ncbi:tetratricopeptide repeat protein [Nocardiopsis eucommiae]|uniref:tetratricopeptide repeat protein n=1 Tax=Nocardiopsis eucommiae TaxID=2831970 RepID=UPI003D758D8A
MAPPPEAHNHADGPVYGHLVQARDIHGGVTVNAAPVAAPVHDVSLDPPRPSTAVRGRDSLLDALRAAMERGAPVPHVLTGPGGFGKTTVAASLAEHARSEGWTVFWVRPDTIQPSMLEAAVELGGSRQEADQFRAAPRQAARWVWRHLDAAPRPWLLVIDNADQPELLDPENRPGEQRGWMRSSPGGFVLVTSRVDDPGLWAPATVHRLGSLHGQEAVDALVDHAGGRRPSGSDELAARLGGIPLALSLAGRILATHGVLFPDARSLLEHIEEDVSRLDALATPMSQGGGTERQLLSGVWNVSLRLVSDQNPQAIPLLRVLAVFGSDGRAVPMAKLPLEDLRGGRLDLHSIPLDAASLARTLNALVVHGLVTVIGTGNDMALQLHPLVSEGVRSGMTEQDLPLVEEMGTLLDRQGEQDLRFQIAARGTLARLWSKLSAHSEEDSNRTPEFTNQRELGRALLLIGLPEPGERLFTKLVADATRVLGAENSFTLKARHFLAEAKMYQGLLDEAEEEFRALLSTVTSALGADDVATTEVRYMLALVLVRRERWAEAEKQLQRVYDERVATSGETEPSVLFTAATLAYVAVKQGRAREGERTLRRVYAIRESTLGAEHSQTLNVLQDLAHAVETDGRLAEAERMFRRVRDVRREHVGAGLPDTVLAEKDLERVRAALARAESGAQGTQEG